MVFTAQENQGREAGARQKGLAGLGDWDTGPFPSGSLVPLIPISQPLSVFQFVPSGLDVSGPPFDSLGKGTKVSYIASLL